jgi:hypothetical protein
VLPIGSYFFTLNNVYNGMLFEPQVCKHIHGWLALSLP